MLPVMQSGMVVKNNGRFGISVFKKKQKQLVARRKSNMEIHSFAKEL